MKFKTIFITLLMVISATIVRAQEENIEPVAVTEIVIPTEVVEVKAPAPKVEYSASQKFELERMRMRTKSIENTVIPIVAIVFSFITPMLIVFIVAFYHHRLKRARLKVVEKAIELGKELPIEFFIENNKKRDTNYFLQGAVLFSVGIGLMILAPFYKVPALMGAGATAGLLGIAQLGYWKIVENKKNKNNQE